MHTKRKDLLNSLEEPHQVIFNQSQDYNIEIQQSIWVADQLTLQPTWITSY